MQQTQAAVTCVKWNPGGEEIPFLLGQDCLEELPRVLKPWRPDRVIVVSQEQLLMPHSQELARLLARTAPVVRLCVGEGESAKTLGALEDLAGRALADGATRRSVVVAFGGGMVCNLAGMLAATLYRGVRLVHVPTTLLAMHDTVTSLKQAVNVGGRKNLLGVYHAPSAILCDLRFATTLPQSAIQGALAEIVKNAMVLGGEYVDHARRLISRKDRNSEGFLENVVKAGVEAKRSLMRADPHERGEAIVFEYGHTVGHAIEAVCGGELNHGQCVAWGMRVAGELALNLRLLAPKAYDEHQRLVDLLGPLPTPTRPLSVQGLVEAIAMDNKRGHLEQRDGKAAMVLLKGVGTPVKTGPLPLLEVPLTQVRRSLRTLPFVGR